MNVFVIYEIKEVESIPVKKRKGIYSNMKIVEKHVGIQYDQLAHNFSRLKKTEWDFTIEGTKYRVEKDVVIKK